MQYDNISLSKDNNKYEGKVTTMARKEEVTIKDRQEVQAITAETITLSASEVSHIKSVKHIIDELTAELEAYKEAVREKYEHKAVKGKLVNLTIIDRLDFDRKRFEAENKETFEAYKTLPVHQERVTF